MDDEDLIRDQMENTRTSLTEKLQTLEENVANTVDNATSNVAETVEAVTDTVQETVATVQESISAVKDSVKEGVNTVKDAFDIPAHVQKHPWAMMGGSVALGFLLGNYFGPKQTALNQKKKDSSGAHSGRNQGNGKQPSNSAGSGSLLQKIAPELEQLKGLAIGALMSTLRDMILPAVPQTFADSLAGIINNVTEKLGGTSFQEKGKAQELGQTEPEVNVESNILGSRWAQAK